MHQTIRNLPELHLKTGMPVQIQQPSLQTCWPSPAPTIFPAQHNRIPNSPNRLLTPRNPQAMSPWACRRASIPSRLSA